LHTLFQNETTFIVIGLQIQSCVGRAAGFHLLNPSRHWQCHLFCVLLLTDPFGIGTGVHFVFCFVQIAGGVWLVLASLVDGPALLVPQQQSRS
jgi:hypothetical protein